MTNDRDELAKAALSRPCIPFTQLTTTVFAGLVGPERARTQLWLERTSRAEKGRCWGLEEPRERRKLKRGEDQEDVRSNSD